MKRRQQRLRIAIRDGQHGNLRQRGRILQRESFCIGCRADPGSEWIAGIQRRIQYAAALHSLCGRIGPFGKDVVHGIAIVGGIGVNDAADRAVLGSQLRLDAAPDFAVARNDDRALYRDAIAGQLLVILDHTIVHINQRRGHIAIRRVGVIRGQLFVFLIACRIAGNRRFLQFGVKLRRRDHLQQSRLRRGKEHLKVSICASQPHCLYCARIHSAFCFVIRRPDMMRPRTEQLHIGAHPLGIGDRVKALLQVQFGLRICGRKSQQCRIVLPLCVDAGQMRRQAKEKAQTKIWWRGATFLLDYTKFVDRDFQGSSRVP